MWKGAVSMYKCIDKISGELIETTTENKLKQEVKERLKEYQKATLKQTGTALVIERA